MAGELSRARVSYGATSGSPGSDTFTALANVTSVSGPDGQNAEIEVTELLSTAKEYIADLPDFGTITVSANKIVGDTTQDAVRDLFFNRNLRNWRIEFLDISDAVVETADFIAFVQGFSTSEEQSSARTLEVTLRVTGTIAFS